MVTLLILLTVAVALACERRRAAREREARERPGPAPVAPAAPPLLPAPGRGPGVRRARRQGAVPTRGARRRAPGLAGRSRHPRRARRLSLAPPSFQRKCRESSDVYDVPTSAACSASHSVKRVGPFGG